MHTGGLFKHTWMDWTGLVDWTDDCMGFGLTVAFTQISISKPLQGVGRHTLSAGGNEQEVLKSGCEVNMQGWCYSVTCVEALYLQYRLVHTNSRILSR